MSKDICKRNKVDRLCFYSNVLTSVFIKKLKLTDASEKLKFLSKTAAEPIYKALRSAVANATQNGKVKESDLKIENILIDEGARMRRRDTSHRESRDAGTIHKRTSHIKIILTDGK